MKRFVLAIASLAVASLLLALLVWAGDIDIGLLVDSLMAIRTGPLALIALTTIMILGISAYKWKLVTKTLQPEASPSDGLPFYFFYTCLGGVFGLVLPPHISNVIVRSIGLKLHHRVPLGHGASTSLIEQMFDLLIPAACAGPGLLFFFYRYNCYCYCSFLILLFSIIYMVLPAYGDLYTGESNPQINLLQWLLSLLMKNMCWKTL